MHYWLWSSSTPSQGVLASCRHTTKIYATPCSRHFLNRLVLDCIFTGTRLAGTSSAIPWTLAPPTGVTYTSHVSHIGHQLHCAMREDLRSSRQATLSRKWVDVSTKVWRGFSIHSTCTPTHVSVVPPRSEFGHNTVTIHYTLVYNYILKIRRCYEVPTHHDISRTSYQRLHLISCVFTQDDTRAP